MTEWKLVNRSELTEEERQMERELCEEERMDGQRKGVLGHRTRPGTERR